MNQKRTLIAIVLLLVSLLATACETGVSAQEVPDSASPLVYEIDMSESGVSVPEELPGGIVTLAFANGTEAQQMAILARLNEGVTAEQFSEALAAENPMPAFAMVRWLGGLSLPAGAEQEMVYELDSAEHVLLVFTQQGPQTGFIQVTDEVSIGRVPEADIQAELINFALILPDEIQAGPQTWHIKNIGEQWHEMHILKAHENVAAQEIIDYLSQGPVPSGPAPFESVAFVAPLDPEEEVWTTFDLEPGEYTVLCALPDITVTDEEHAHAEKGMIRKLIVTE